MLILNILFLVLLFIVNLILLQKLQFPIYLQMINLTGILYIFLVGYGFLKFFLKKIWNRWLFIPKAFFSFFVGSGIIVLTSFLFYHKPILEIFSFKTQQASWLVSFLLLPFVLYGLFFLLRNVFQKFVQFAKEIQGKQILFFWGYLVAIFCTFGYLGHSTSPLWGANNDRNYHLDLFIRDFISNGISSDVFHCGLPVLCHWLTSFSELLTPWNVYKSISIICFCAIPFFTYLISREILRLNLLWSNLIGILSLCWGTINIPIFELSRSHYMGGFLGAAGSGFYASDTLSFSYAFCVAAAYIAACGIKEKRGEFFSLSSFLFCLSFFFKPSGYTIFGPPLFFIIILTCKKDSLKVTLTSLFILILPFLLWFSYPFIRTWLTGETIIMFAPKLLFAPFHDSLMYSKDRFYSIIENNLVLKSVAIALCSYLIFLIGCCLYLKSWQQLSKEDKLLYFFANSVLLLGIASGTFFSDGMGNFTWATMESLVFFIPFLFKIFFKSQSFVLKFIFLLVAGLHVCGGLLHLYLYTFKGHI